MTIQQLEDFSNTKPELRYLTEEIIKYMTANPGGGGATYKKYVGIFNQAGTDAPTVTILENTIGDIVWTRQAPGQYVGTLAGAFPYPNMVAFPGNSQSTYWIYSCGYLNAPNTILVSATETTTGNNIDDALIDVPIEIRVYP